MGLFSNISAFSHPLFQGITKRARTVGSQSSTKRTLRNILSDSDEEVSVEKAHQQRVRKDMAMMRRQGIDPVDDYHG